MRGEENLNRARLLEFLKGTVKIRATGDFLERFLNVCMRRGIFLTSIKRTGKREITARMGIGGFKAIRPVAKKTRTRVRMVAREGMPFVLQRYKNRRFALVGVLAFVVLMWYFSSHIMGLSIYGNERISSAEIEKGLKEFGLYRGAATAKLEPRLIQNKMMTAFGDIAWIGVNIKGSRAHIEVRERLATKVALDTHIPCNLVASRSGIIEGLEIAEGQTMVKLHDMVEEGELLVSGIIDSSVHGMRYVHSSGRIYAQTRYVKSVDVPLKYTEKQYTGKKRSRFSVKFFGKSFDLFIKNRKPFEYSDQSEPKEWQIAEKFGVVRQEFLEYVPEEKVRSIQEAVDTGGGKLLDELKSEIGESGEILEENVTFVQKDAKTISVTAEILCREDIARQSVIDKIDDLDYNIKDEI